MRRARGLGAALMAVHLGASAADWHCQPGAPDGPQLIVLAGWTVQTAWARTWAQALAEAGQGWCAVRGPQQPSFVPADIGTGALARERAAAWGLGSAAITLVAHSSGAFVAHSLLQHWRAQGQWALLRRVRYFNLDGGLGEGATALDADLIARLGAVHAVLARDPGTGSESANAAAMRRWVALAPDSVRLQVLDASASGCNPGAKWCLHQVLVTLRPHNPAGFDLARDYGHIGPERPVQAAYLR